MSSIFSINFPYFLYYRFYQLWRWFIELVESGLGKSQTGNYCCSRLISNPEISILCSFFNMDNKSTSDSYKLSYNQYVCQFTNQHWVQIHPIHVQPFHLVQKFVLCLTSTHSTVNKTVNTKQNVSVCGHMTSLLYNKNFNSCIKQNHLENQTTFKTFKACF